MKIISKVRDLLIMMAIVLAAASPTFIGIFNSNF
jgi:hypothetical protein